MAKSAYEIRLDLLVLAQTILENQKSLTEMVSKKIAAEDVIAEAEKLNTFVSKDPGLK